MKRHHILLASAFLPLFLSGCFNGIDTWLDRDKPAPTEPVAPGAARIKRYSRDHAVQMMTQQMIFFLTASGYENVQTEIPQDSGERNLIGHVLANLLKENITSFHSNHRLVVRSTCGKDGVWSVAAADAATGKTVFRRQLQLETDSKEAGL